jgi:hypothetical protein
MRERIILRSRTGKKPETGKFLKGKRYGPKKNLGWKDDL